MSTTMNLTIEQQEAIDEIDRNLQIIACAGSGKTEVITRRIANILRSKPDVRPENIVAFTFTEKAAASMKSRIIKVLGNAYVNDVNQMYIGTIHGFCYHLLNQYTEQFREYQILDTVKSHLFVTRYANECGMKDFELDVYPRNVKLFLQCIDKMIDDYDNADTWTQKQSDVLNRYIASLYEHNYIDFSLLVFETLRQIDTNPQVQLYLSTIKYLVVDEYQDVNDLQEKLILRIAEAGANICVVGDDDQTIYQFRGSNADNMISFSERYVDVHQVRLEKNFRCASGIVDVADCVIRHNERRLPKKMVSGATELEANIVANCYFDQTDEFQAITEEIKKLHTEGVPYSEIAILVRKGKVIAPISHVLEEAEIPYETDSAEYFFKGNYFNRFVNTFQILTDVDKVKLYECWKDLVDGQAFNVGYKYLRSCSRGGNFKLSEIIREFCEKIHFIDEAAEDIEARRIDLEGIVKILDDYDEIYSDWQLTARINGVLQFLGTQAEDEYKYHSFKPKDDSLDTVHIMTVHKAKGLEFHTVFLPELMKREFPILNMGGKKYYHVLGGVFEENKAKYQSDLEDERKLFYVAVTRAKQNLYMTYELSAQPVSCFVAESAESHYLNIDRNDLNYRPERLESNKDILKGQSSRDSKAEWELEQQQRQEYWELVKYARSQLYDYYGTGAHFCPAMYTMLGEIKKWSPEQILSEACKNGLI